MAYHRPIPEEKRRPKDGDAEGGSGIGSGVITAWVQAEKMIQIAMILPSAGFIGWLAGYGLDRWLHQNWMATAGIIFGIIAGLVAAVRMAIAYAGDQDGDSGGGSAQVNGKPAQDSGDSGDAGKTL